MKIWILKNDLSRSPQAAFKLYECSYKKKNTSPKDFDQQLEAQFFSNQLLTKLKRLVILLLQKVKRLNVILA